MVAKIQSIISKNRGFVSVYLVIAMAFLMPFAFLVTLDLPYIMTMNRKIKNTADNAAASAIVAINESQLSHGILEINTAEAEAIVHQVIQESFGYGPNYEITDYSLLEDAPTVEVKVLNQSDIAINNQYETKNGVFTIEHPSVVVAIEFPVKALVYRNFTPVIKQTGISQVTFR